MKNLVKKTAAGVFVAGLTFGFAPAAFAADATPACWVDAVEQAEIHYANENGKLTELQVTANIALDAKQKADDAVKAAKAKVAAAKKAFEDSKTDAAPDGDAAKKKALDDANTELKAAVAKQKSANAEYKEAKGYADIQEGTVKNYAYPALKKIQDADPAAYNKAHGCKATPSNPEQKPGKPEVKPGKPEVKPGKSEDKTGAAGVADSKKPAKKQAAKPAKGDLASTGAVAASLAGIALASVAGGTGVVAWRRHKA